MSAFHAVPSVDVQMAAYAESRIPAVVSAADQVYQVYDQLLELRSIIDAFGDLAEQPSWSFGVGRWVQRLTLMAKGAHDSVQQLHGVVVARDAQ